MTVEQWTVQVAVCDHNGCTRYGPASEESFTHALMLAMHRGWDVDDKPKLPGTIADTLTYCPDHRRDGVPNPRARPDDPN